MNWQPSWTTPGSITLRGPIPAIGYGTTKSKSTIYFTTSFPAGVTGKSVQRIRVKTKGSVVENLIFPLPETVIKSLETDSVNTGIDYQVLREFILNVPSGASSITLTTNRTNETFVANASKTVIYCIENIVPTTPSVDWSWPEYPSIDITQDNGRKLEPPPWLLRSRSRYSSLSSSLTPRRSVKSSVPTRLLR